MTHTPPEEQDGVLSRIFQGKSTAKVLDFFIDHVDLDYSLGEVSEKAKISIQTASREIGHLENIGFLKNQRTIGKTAMYRLNQNIPEMKLLEEFTLQISQTRSFQQYPTKIERQEIIETTINS